MNRERLLIALLLALVSQHTEDAAPTHYGRPTMPKIGYHVSHEQFAPKDLLDWVQVAEQAGFALAMCSDHFHPWSERRY